VPAGFADWHWATQLNQARATAYAVVHLRSHAPRTMGSIIWQLNDCWPVTSWAMVDGAGRRKPAWYALRRTYADRLLAFRAGGVLVAVNDSDEPWRERVSLRRLGFDGAAIAAGHADLDVAPRSVALVTPAADLLAATDPTREVLVADAAGRRATHLFAEDRDLAYRAGAVSADVAAVEGGYSVTVTASSFARDVAVLADRVAPDAEVDDMLVDLLPGESHTFTVTTAAAVDPRAFAAPEVLRTARVE
jgi:beta-mannosidase